MTLRTRLAFMVILLLLGCVFAAPYYRSAVSQDQAASTPSLPTLQIQRSFEQSLDKSSQERGAAAATSLGQNAESQPQGEFPPKDSEKLTARAAVGETKPVLFNKPIPDLQMPTPSRGIRANAAMAPKTLRTKPASLTGISSERFGEYPSEPPKLASNIGNDQPSRFSSSTPRLTKYSDGFQPKMMTPVPRVPRAESQRHRVARYDSLDEISKQYYGSSKHALFIFEANRGALVSPAILPIGLELTIPTKPNRTPQIQAWLPDSAPNAPRVPEPSEKLPALPIENQYGWKRVQDETELLD